MHWIARINARATVICSASLYYSVTVMVRLEAEVETQDATQDATNVSNYVFRDSDKTFPLEKKHTIGIQWEQNCTNSYIGVE